ncbi:MAG: hypothetical protein WBV37_10005, partial [Nocardioidaceae bacterium]
MSTRARARLLACGSLAAVIALTMSLTSCSGPGPVDPSTDISTQSFSVPTVRPKDTHYVSPNGEDAGLGTADKPWKTLNYALRHVYGGDVLYVHGGTYNEQLAKLSLHRGRSDA